MASRDYSNQSEHDKIVYASSRTYSEMETKGYKVSVNPNGEKNFYVGGKSNPRYPDVLVWMPDQPGSNSGKVAAIEEIETADSVTKTESGQWKDYASLSMTFRLIVPKGYAKDVAGIVDSEKINVSEIWYYYSENGNIKFDKYR